MLRFSGSDGLVAPQNFSRPPRIMRPREPFQMRCTSQVRRILCNSAPAAGVRRMEFGPSGLWPIVDLRRRSIPVPSIRDTLVLKRENVKT